MWKSKREWGSYRLLRKNKRKEKVKGKAVEKLLKPMQTFPSLYVS